MKQNSLRFHASPFVVFDKEDYKADDVVDCYFELASDAFVILKTKPINILEELDGIETELELIAGVEVLKSNESGSSYTRVPFLSFAISKDKAKGCSSYVELPFKNLSISYIQNKNDELCEF